MESNTTITIPISSAVACTKIFGIGRGGTLPWLYPPYNHSLPGDMSYFKRVMTENSAQKKKRLNGENFIKLTSNAGDFSNKRNAVIMGRLTWESIPEKNRPLKNRINIIISSKTIEQLHPNYNNTDQIYVANSLETAIDLILNDTLLRDIIERIVVIGGKQLFEDSISHKWFDTLHLTMVEVDYDCDVYLSKKTIDIINNNKPSRISEKIIENGITYQILEYEFNQIDTIRI